MQAALLARAPDREPSGQTEERASSAARALCRAQRRIRKREPDPAARRWRKCPPKQRRPFLFGATVSVGSARARTMARNASVFRTSAVMRRVRRHSKNIQPSGSSRKISTQARSKVTTLSSTLHQGVAPAAARDRGDPCGRRESSRQAGRRRPRAPAIAKDRERWGRWARAAGNPKLDVRRLPDHVAGLRQRERVDQFAIAGEHSHHAGSGGEESERFSFHGERQRLSVFGLNANGIRIDFRFQLHIHRADGARRQLPGAKCIGRHPANDVGEQQRRGELVFHSRSDGMKTEHHHFRIAGARDDQRPASDRATTMSPGAGRKISALASSMSRARKPAPSG